MGAYQNCVVSFHLRDYGYVTVCQSWIDGKCIFVRVGGAEAFVIEVCFALLH